MKETPSTKTTRPGQGSRYSLFPCQQNRARLPAQPLPSHDDAPSPPSPLWIAFINSYNCPSCSSTSQPHQHHPPQTQRRGVQNIPLILATFPSSNLSPFHASPSIFCAYSCHSVRKPTYIRSTLHPLRPIPFPLSPSPSTTPFPTPTPPAKRSKKKNKNIPNAPDYPPPDAPGTHAARTRPPARASRRAGACGARAAAGGRAGWAGGG